MMSPAYGSRFPGSACWSLITKSQHTKALFARMERGGATTVQTVADRRYVVTERSRQFVERARNLDI